MRRVALALLPLLVIGLGVEVVGARADVGSYERLLPTVLRPAEDPIFGEGEFEYATTYGLVLSAALAAGDTATADDAAAWLMDDLVEGGWGMAWTWDPFSDGSPTPAGTPFGTTTAIAVGGLMDRGLDAATAEAVGDVLLTWAREAWSDGYFWYSLAPQDAIDVTNVNASLAGVAARFLAAHGATALTQDEASFLRERIEGSFRHLAATSRPQLRWAYSADQPILNDTGSHAAILWGGEQARAAGIPVAWTHDEAVASLDAYGPVYPPDVVLTPSMARREDSPWQTAGTGAALAWAATWGGDLLRWSAAMCETLELTERVPRFDAYALVAMALVGWCDCPDRPRLIPGVARSC
jgi:hypothetical protein